MLKRASQLLMIVLFLLDMALTSGAWMGAYVLRFETEWMQVWIPSQHASHAPMDEYLRFLPLVLPVCAVVYRLMRFYTPRRDESFWIEFLDIAKANAVLFLLVVSLATFYAPTVYSRAFFGIFVAANAGFLCVERGAARGVLRWLRSRGWNQRYAIVVGAGKAAQHLAETLDRNRWTAIRPIGFLDSNPARVGRQIDGLEILGTYDELVDILRKRTVDQVVFALPLRDLALLEDLVEKAAHEMVDIRIVPDFLSLRTLHAHVGEIDGLPIISLQESPLSGMNQVAKRTMDVGLSVLFLAIFGLPMLVIAAFVKFTSPGPVFYRQARMGLDGRVFQMLKFRTMRANAEAGTGAIWARPSDPRRTGLGSFLRATSLDELPQFFNVLAGDMSIVGPRPERPIFIQEFRHQVPNYMLRHRMKAGITGWAQVNGWRGDTSLKKRIQYDLYYIENWSIWFDLRIMLMTVAKGFVHKNAY